MDAYKLASSKNEFEPYLSSNKFPNIKTNIDIKEKRNIGRLVIYLRKEDEYF
jgi:hypothetical protein